MTAPWQSPVVPWDLCSDERKNALRVAWSAGDLRYKLHPEQLAVQNEILTGWGKVDNSLERIHTCDISRQFGKDFGMSVLGIGQCMKRRKPARIVYAAPTRDSLKELIVPTIVDVFRDCPPDLLPTEIRKGTFERSADTLTWPWGARIVLVGVELHPDRLRGPATFGFLFTECAFVPNLVELMDGIILPQLLTIPDGWVVMASTPPVVPAHPWTVKYIPEAKARGMYSKRVIDDNKRLGPTQIEAAIRALGGRESARVRRELYCEHIVDVDSVVISEWSGDNVVPNDYKCPEWRDCYTSLDPGFVHATGALGGYYDFVADKFVIEWDFAKPGLNSSAVARVIKAREWQLWGIEPKQPPSMTDQAWKVELEMIRAEFYPGLEAPAKPVLSQRNGQLRQAPAARYSDTASQLIAGLSTEHSLTFTPAKKDDLEAAINSFRLRVQEKRIVVKERAVGAINHFQNAQWNKQRTRFAEMPGGAGHYDILAAAVYLNRMLPWGRNPNPPNWVDPRTHFIPKATTAGGRTAQALGAMFGFKGGTRRR